MTRDTLVDFLALTFEVCAVIAALAVWYVLARIVFAALAGAWRALTERDY